MADLSQFILQFQQELGRRLDSIGYMVLNESCDHADFGKRFREGFDEAIPSILDELCRRPQHVQAGEADPERRAERTLKGTREQRERRAVENAWTAWEADDSDDDEQPPPRDEWENTVRKEHPEMLFPPAKLAARTALEAKAQERRGFFLNLAASRFARVIQPPITSTADAEAHPAQGTECRAPDRKGDVTLLQNPDGSLKVNVSFAAAEKYLGIGSRRRQKLMSDERLLTVGTGHQTQITVASLLAYLSAKENPNQKRISEQNPH